MTSLLLAAPTACADIATFAQRASRYDAEAILRVLAVGPMLAVVAATPFDAIAIRTFALAEDAHVDVVVEAVGLAARAHANEQLLDLPPTLPALRWTSSLPPRSGWAPTANLPVGQVQALVDDAVAEFKARVSASQSEGTTLAAARAAMESVAADVWGREFAGGATIGLAHAATSFGFLPDSTGDVVIREAGTWVRLDAPFGAVATRRMDPLGLFPS